MELDVTSLERGGALIREGKNIGVKVLLHDPNDLSPRSMAERRDFLRSEFDHLRKLKNLRDVAIEIEELSVPGQTVRAVIPLKKWARAIELLNAKGFRVIPRLKLNAVGYSG